MPYCCYAAGSAAAGAAAGSAAAAAGEYSSLAYLPLMRIEAQRTLPQSAWWVSCPCKQSADVLHTGRETMQRMLAQHRARITQFTAMNEFTPGKTFVVFVLCSPA
jgi:hypothetical protein